MYTSCRHARDGRISSITDVIGHHVTTEKEDEVETGGMLHARNRNVEVAHEYPMVWYHKVVWVLHDMITGAAPVVSVP